jgi:hypothetical protein
MSIYIIKIKQKYNFFSQVRHQDPIKESSKDRLGSAILRESAGDIPANLFQKFFEKFFDS